MKIYETRDFAVMLSVTKGMRKSPLRQTRPEKPEIRSRSIMLYFQ